MTENGSYQVRWMGKTSGPFSTEQLKTMLGSGQLSKHHQVSQDGVLWQTVADSPLMPKPQVAVRATAVRRSREAFDSEQPELQAQSPEWERASVNLPPVPERYDLEGRLGAAGCDGSQLVRRLLANGGGGWMQFIAVLSIIGGGFQCIGAVLSLVSALSETGNAVAVTLITSLVGFAMAWLTLLPAFRLKGSVSSMRLGLDTGNAALFDQGMDRLRSFFCIIGLYAAISLVISIILLIVFAGAIGGAISSYAT